jgi:DNA-binding protein
MGKGDITAKEYNMRVLGYVQDILVAKAKSNGSVKVVAFGRARRVAEDAALRAEARMGNYKPLPALLRTEEVPRKDKNDRPENDGRKTRISVIEIELKKES